jgi:CRP-like cAMP-binding protein
VRDTRITGALLQCPLFYGRPIHALVASCRLRQHAAGATLFRPGDPAGHLTVLGTGRVELYTLRFNRQHHPVATLRAPDAVLDAGLFSTERRHRLGATAASAVDAVEVPRDAVVQAAAEDAVLTARLITALADATDATDATRAAGPLDGSTAHRLLACLERLAATFGVSQPDGSVLVGIPLSADDLAGLVAATPADVAAAEAELEASGAVERLAEYLLLPGES